MSRRDQIRMTDDELRAFLEDQRTLICATNGAGGWPHLMPLWFVVRGHDLWAWTYAKSQKVRNLERDPRVTLQLETGETYDQLRGVMFEATAELHRDTDAVAALGRDIFARYAAPRGQPPVAELAAEVEAMVAAQAAKRVGLEFAERRRASWDHRKLGGVY
jgi:PPOX class probable F420-dependent enzyme